MTTTQHITSSMAVALALTTAAAPASARTSEVNAAGSYIPPYAPTTVVIATPRDGGFKWGDAGIGAAGGLGLAIAGLGGALTVSHRRTRRTRHNPAQ